MKPNRNEPLPIGVYRPRPVAPGFGTVVYQLGEKQFIKRFSEEGGFSVWVECNLSLVNLRPLPTGENLLLKDDEKCDAFEFPDGEIVVAPADLLRLRLRDRAKELFPYTFVCAEVARYILDFEFERAAERRCAEILKSVRHPEPRDNVADSQVDRGGANFLEIFQRFVRGWQTTEFRPWRKRSARELENLNRVKVRLISGAVVILALVTGLHSLDVSGEIVVTLATFLIVPYLYWSVSVLSRDKQM